MYDRILVPLDGSDLARQALPHAIALTNQFGSTLHLIEVVTHYTPEESSSDYQAGHNLEETRAHQRMEELLQQLKTQVKTPIITRVVSGTVVDLLLEYADQQRIELIVMATHGRSGLRRLVYGSIAERVLRSSQCPVLLVRVREEDLN